MFVSLGERQKVQSASGRLGWRPLPYQAKPAISLIGTKLPIWDVVATVATGGNPDMTRAAQFSRG
jgi:hypothetical protein